MLTQTGILVILDCNQKRFYRPFYYSVQSVDRYRYLNHVGEPHLLLKALISDNCPFAFIQPSMFTWNPHTSSLHSLSPLLLVKIHHHELMLRQDSQ